MDYGRFTVSGGPGVEGLITTLVNDAADVMRRAIPAGALKSAILLGGYGRGEGGVEQRPDGEHPHNNLDFLVVTKGGSTRGHGAIKERLDRELEPLSRTHGVGLDVGLVSENGLLNAPCLVMWYDMRHGHKPVLGDPDFVRSIDRFEVGRIVPSDVRDLLVNRGTLLVINDEIADTNAMDETLARTVVKHTVKAIIGYGDALLFFLGDYHWSYVEKRKRMSMCFDLPEELRRAYDEAMEFRFRPDYSRWSPGDAAGWSRDTRKVLETAHVRAEELRLGTTGLVWKAYPELALSTIPTDGLSSARALARRALNLARGSSAPMRLGWAARLGWRMSSPADRLALAFPAVAYGTTEPEVRQTAGKILRTGSTDDRTLRRAYLEAWGRHSDINFAAVARKLGLPVAEWGAK